MPVRCVGCGERTFTTISQYLKLRSERKARHRRLHPAK
jgi:DNA-directed RNA polymerase subunit N (RpoN/RPB10)